MSNVATTRRDVPAGDVVHGLPGRAYTDPAVLDAEYARVFAPSWCFVGFAHELGRPGDAVTVAGQPLVLVRNAEGRIKALHNVCRHRGHTVVGEACRGQCQSKFVYFAKMSEPDFVVIEFPEFFRVDLSGSIAAPSIRNFALTTLEGGRGSARRDSRLSRSTHYRRTEWSRLRCKLRLGRDPERGDGKHHHRIRTSFMADTLGMDPTRIERLRSPERLEYFHPDQPISSSWANSITNWTPPNPC